MDKLKGMADKAMHKQGSSSAKTSGGGQQDYVDKGLAGAEKKAGFSQSAATNEKITDGGRELFEKDTGKKIPTKFSN